MFEDPNDEIKVRRILVEVYMDLDLDMLVKGVPEDFLQAPCRTLADLLDLAAATKRMALRQPEKADDLMASCARFELIAAALLNAIANLKDVAERFEVDQILSSPMGVKSLQNAISNQCRRYLTTHEVQAFFQREWRGRMLNHALENASKSVFAFVFSIFRFSLAVACNALLMLPFAIAPFLETYVFEWLRERDFRKRFNAVETKVQSSTNAALKTTYSSFEPRKVRNLATVGWMAKATIRSKATVVPNGAATRESRSSSARYSASASEAGKIAGARHETLFAWYLLRTPSFKFSMKMASDLVLACLLTFINIVDDALSDQWAESDIVAYNTFLLLWAVAGCLSEYGTLGNAGYDTELLSLFRRDRISMYRTDFFNHVDFICFHLLLVVLALARSSYFLRTRVIAYSAATTLSWLRLLRVLQLSSSMGPMVLMFIEMLKDVVQNLLLMGFVVFAFTAGLFIVFNSVRASQMQAGEWPPPLHDEACEDLVYLNGRVYDSWISLFFVLGNGMLTGDNFAACLIQAADPRLWVWAWTLSYSFLILTAVLLLNMLIAVMAKTFDNVWESSEINHKYLFGRAVFFQTLAPAEPPPLSILRLPVQILWAAAKALAFVVPNGTPAERKVNQLADWLRRVSDSSTYVDASSSTAPHLNNENEYVGTTIAGRNTFKNWRTGGMDQEALRER